MRYILGIDPGLSGGLSIIDENLNFIACYPMPIVKGLDGKNKVCARSVRDILIKHSPALVAVEKVGARPGQGVVSMFSFGEAYGTVKALAEAYCAHVTTPTPQQWRGNQSLSGLSKEQIAEVAFEVFHVEQIYGKPRAGKRAVRDGISDSLMIAKYSIRFLE